MWKFNSTLKKLLLCDTRSRYWRSGSALHYHYTPDSRSLIKPLKLCCLLFTRLCYVFTSFYTSQNTQIIHTSHERWRRENFTIKPFCSNSFSCPSWHTLNTFTALTHLYLFGKTFSLLIYAFTQNRLLDYSLTFFAPLQLSDMKFFFICFIATSWKKKYIPNDCQFFYPIYDDKKFLFIWSQEKSYEIFIPSSRTQKRILRLKIHQHESSKNYFHLAVNTWKNHPQFDFNSTFPI